MATLVLENNVRDAIATAMHADPLLAFSPFGKHLICDGCHYINIYAGTPKVLVVATDADFEAFKDGLSNTSTSSKATSM
jgi:hypothetical protein